MKRGKSKHCWPRGTIRRSSPLRTVPSYATEFDGWQPALLRRSKAQHSAFHCMSCANLVFFCCRTPSTKHTSSFTVQTQQTALMSRSETVCERWSYPVEIILTGLSSSVSFVSDNTFIKCRCCFSTAIHKHNVEVNIFQWLWGKS